MMFVESTTFTSMKSVINDLFKMRKKQLIIAHFLNSIDR